MVESPKAFPDFTLNYQKTVVEPAAEAAREAARVAEEARVAKEAADAAERARETYVAPPPIPQQVSYANSYDYGECTWYVASKRQIPSNWGNANTWLNNSQTAGYTTSTIPRVGAIAWTGEGYYGHVGLVEQVAGGLVQISEMNNSALGGWNRVDLRWANIAEFNYIW